jgi:Zn-dependent protease
VSTFITGPNTICQRCSQPLTPGLLDCSNCHALVHAEDMDRMAAQARALEGTRQFMDARNVWLSILPLLPPNSKQAEWIRGHARELETTAQQSAGAGTGKKWAKRLAPLGPLALILAKFKSALLVLLKLKFLLSFASFIALYWALWGPKFGIGFAVQILIHELGHFIDIKRRGLPANMPVFFPGLGAYVRWNAMGVSLETRAAVSLAGPLAGFLAAGVCALVWYQTRDPIWAALARTGAWLNVLNLTPVFIFDGASAIRALGKIDRGLVLAVSAALGYATGEMAFFIVAAGATWALATALFARRAPAQDTMRLGFSQPAPVTGTMAAPEALAPARHESHFITAYFLAVLTALAMLLWMVPRLGHLTR